ncbi:MAG TPA: aromatic amino acid transport family protein [Candidatus Paceibacterota bacterium]|nr:aromatic amino acid transport family protein [Candidatus Paceibacterota bacterium]
MNKRLTIAAIVAAATIGEGVFAVPYIIQNSGWAVTFGYFIAVIALVSVAHILYLRTLASTDEKERLLGLARNYFGAPGFWTGFVAIVVGLLLSSVAYLVLGSQFLQILFPGIAPAAALAVFWALLAILVWGSEGGIAWFEATGIALVSIAILFIFFSGHPGTAFASLPLAVPENFFLPFGVVIFALAGWTCVEPVYELAYRKGDDRGAKSAKSGEKPLALPGAFWLFALGTAFAGLLYWLFAAGVIGTTGSQMTADTVSGIAAWPLWRKDILAAIGLLSVCVVSVPIAREIRGAMEKDLGWNSTVSRSVIVLLPLAAVLSGFNNFLAIIGLAGGVFISTQYLLIISVGRRTLALAQREKILLDVVAVVFICAAVYEIWHFVV